MLHGLTPLKSFIHGAASHTDTSAKLQQIQTTLLAANRDCLWAILRHRPGISSTITTATQYKLTLILTRFSTKFSCCNRQLMGEDPATLTDGDWRRWCDHRPDEVPDGSYSEFVCGKQINVWIPRSLYPTYKDRWRAVCQRLLTRGSILCMSLIFTKYEGNDSDLSSKDKALLSPSEDSYIKIPISTQPKSAKMQMDVITTITL